VSTPAHGLGKVFGLTSFHPPEHARRRTLKEKSQAISPKGPNPDLVCWRIGDGRPRSYALRPHAAPLLRADHVPTHSHYRSFAITNYLLVTYNQPALQNIPKTAALCLAGGKTISQSKKSPPPPSIKAARGKRDSLVQDKDRVKLSKLSGIMARITLK